MARRSSERGEQRRDGRGRDERRVDRRHEQAARAGYICRVETGEHRGQLAGVGARILDKPRRPRQRRHLVAQRVILGTPDDERVRTPPSQSARARRRTKDSPPGPHGSSGFARPMRVERPAARITPGTMDRNCKSGPDPERAPRCWRVECPCGLESQQMTTDDLQMRCQRCGTQMEMRDPAPGTPWKPDKFWVCPACGRHFWTTHPAEPPVGAEKSGRKPLKTVDSGGAPNCLAFLTSRPEVPTLTPFSSSGAPRPWPAARESRVHRQVVGAFQQFAGRLLRPELPAQLVASP